MKWFWIIIGVLALAAGALLVNRSRGNDNATGDVRETSTAAQPVPTAPEVPAEASAPSPNLQTESAADPAREPALTEAASDEAAAPEAYESAGTDAPDADLAVPEAAPEAPDALATDEPAPVEPDAPATELAEPAEPLVEAAAGAETGGSGLKLNGRHEIPGEGTAENPYVLNWDTLVAVENEYEPKVEGKKEVPEWIKPLDGKHVALTGFVAFPFIAPTADECMVMLNQWDGCCIGVPPTPYDAVEVKLSAPIDLQQGVINYGTLTGVFRTDPYLVNGWLIGLYVMDEARIENSGARGQSGY